jgi:23S rRNA pseudouridine1911/1915/1917 synthase
MVSRSGAPPTPEPSAPQRGAEGPAPAGGEPRTYVVGQADAGLRLDRFLQARAPALSRARLQGLIASGHVRVEGGRARASHRLRVGAQVTVHIPPPEPVALVPEPFPLDIVHEDAHLLVVNKPVGLVVHPGAGHRAGTLVHALLAHCGPALSGIGGTRRPGIVHRLDRGTSGLLVVAKTDAAHQALAQALKARTVERRYLALVHGRVPHAEGQVEAAIGRDPRDRLRMAVRPPGSGRPALTRYRVLERFAAPVPLTWLEVTLGTGRTHQIRVHLAHLGFPVVGDRTYGRRGVAALGPGLGARVAALGGQALHAATLAFVHPATGARLRFAAPVPPALADLLAWLRAHGSHGSGSAAGGRAMR